jgi:transcription elongation factor SPT6
MSSPIPDELLPQPHLGEMDDPMQGSGQEEEEGEGDVLMPGVTDDSSEEGEDDEEEFRLLADGFIVDEEEEEEEEEEAPRKRRKRRKRHHGEYQATGFRGAFLALMGMSLRNGNIGRR